MRDAWCIVTSPNLAVASLTAFRLAQQKKKAAGNFYIAKSTFSLLFSFQAGLLPLEHHGECFPVVWKVLYDGY